MHGDPEDLSLSNMFDVVSRCKEDPRVVPLQLLNDSAWCGLKCDVQESAALLNGLRDLGAARITRWIIPEEEQQNHLAFILGTEIGALDEHLLGAQEVLKGFPMLGILVMPKKAEIKSPFSFTSVIRYLSASREEPAGQIDVPWKCARALIAARAHFTPKREACIVGASSQTCSICPPHGSMAHPIAW